MCPICEGLSFAVELRFAMIFLVFFPFIEDTILFSFFTKYVMLVEDEIYKTAIATYNSKW